MKHDIKHATKASWHMKRDSRNNRVWGMKHESRSSKWGMKHEAWIMQQNSWRGHHTWHEQGSTTWSKTWSMRWNIKRGSKAWSITWSMTSNIAWNVRQELHETWNMIHVSLVRVCLPLLWTHSRALVNAGPRLTSTKILKGAWNEAQKHDNNHATKQHDMKGEIWSIKLHEMTHHMQHEGCQESRHRAWSEAWNVKYMTYDMKHEAWHQAWHEAWHQACDKSLMTQGDSWFFGLCLPS